MFPPIDKKWYEQSRKRFVSARVSRARECGRMPYDRIDVDPQILSHAAIACGYTIKDFYTKPELGISCAAYIHQLYGIISPAHWFYSNPWLRELGVELVYSDTMPPFVKEPIIKEPGDVEKLRVPDVDEITKGPTASEFIRAFEWAKNNVPMYFVPITYAFDIVGEIAQLVGIEKFIIWTLKQKDAVHKMLKIFTDTSVNGAIAIANKYGSALLAIGAVLANNDVFSPKAISEFCLPYHKDYIRKAFRGGAGPQLWYHLCGNHELDYMLHKDAVISPFTRSRGARGTVMHIGYEGKEVFPAAKLKEAFGNLCTIMASVDTKLMIARPPKRVYEQAKNQLLGGRDSPRGFILGTSCETPPYTLPGNILALTRAVRDYGTYGTW